MARRNSSDTKKVKAWISVDIGDGNGHQKFHATLLGDREDLGHFDHKGKTYWVSIPWGHSRWEEKPPWKIHSVEQSHRSKRQTERRAAMSADDRAKVDACVLAALRDWGTRGVSVALLTDDCFNNRALEYDVTDYVPKRNRQGVIMAALKRLKAKGKVSMFYGPGERKAEVPYWEVK